jgi:ABC-2 type transport system ATP-binding protein
MENAIEVRGLTKIFRATRGQEKGGEKKDKVTAVDHVNFEVRKGELFGLLGPNGAGKTTTIRMLSTILIPDEGEATVGGHSVTKQESKVRSILGVITGGERGLYWRLTGRENLLFFSRLYNMSDHIAKERTDLLLETVGLADRADDLVERYSRGMRQRLHIARGLIHDPPIVLMDEPTLGLDPAVSRSIREIIKTKLQKEQGKTILLTTHYMWEAESLCDRIAIINRGRIIATGTPTEIKNSARLGSSLSVRVTAFPSGVRLAIESMEGVERVVLEGTAEDGTSQLKILGQNLSRNVAPIVDLLVKNGVQVLSFDQHSPSLEDAYVSLVGDGAGL